MKAVITAILLTVSAGALAADPRYCGPPARTADGEIKRSSAVLAEFKREHPCPSTGLGFGACPRWYMDHVIPLACGGCDSVANLQWLPEAAWRDKSRWERIIYCSKKMGPVSAGP